MDSSLTQLSPPQKLRHLIRAGKYTAPTSGLAPGYTQANLVIVPPQDLAYDFLLFAQRNPKSCPILEVSDCGSKKLHTFAQDVDLAADFPRYRIYRNGKLAQEVTNVSAYWRDDLVSFLIGCSFSFEADLIAAGIEMRHITEGGVNVPMYNTKIALQPAGRFSGNMVVSMRPLPAAQVVTAVKITASMPRVHGAPPFKSAIQQNLELLISLIRIMVMQSQLIQVKSLSFGHAELLRKTPSCILNQRS